MDPVAPQPDDRMTDKEQEALAAGDYFEVSGSRGWSAVSTVMARHIQRELDRLVPRRWIQFVDLSGATVRIRPADIRLVGQCSTDQRAFRRAFDRALDAEDEEWGRSK
jgi:hypothetical protein